MKHLKSLALSLTLMSALSVPAFGGETVSPPCAPGEIQSPPCISQSMTDDSTEPGEILTQPASSSVDVNDITDAVLWALSLF